VDSTHELRSHERVQADSTTALLVGADANDQNLLQKGALCREKTFLPAITRSKNANARQIMF
jgi:hypothetical protein